jgi:transposase
MVINDIKHGAPQGPDPALVGALSVTDRQQMIAIRQKPSYARYGQLLGSRNFKTDIGHCLMISKAVRDSGVNNGAAIRQVCREFVLLCRRLDLFSQALVAIDGSKSKAVNNRDRNYTRALF